MSMPMDTFSGIEMLMVDKLLGYAFPKRYVTLFEHFKINLGIPSEESPNGGKEEIGSSRQEFLYTMD
jgi:hypothetical protein